ncbi:MAG: hypothetical protein MI741_02285, partial [Rhodospirillales bacterium]|nr:hypothetical protein [Rhodospirillales bacterium]
MRYIKSPRNQDNPDAPVLLYSELDDGSREVRKVEVFRSGPPGYASSSESRGRTVLNTEPIPPLPEVESDPAPAEISAEEFETVWRSVIGQDGFQAI